MQRAASATTTGVGGDGDSPGVNTAMMQDPVYAMFVGTKLRGRCLVYTRNVAPRAPRALQLMRATKSMNVALREDALWFYIDDNSMYNNVAWRLSLDPRSVSRINIREQLKEISFFSVLGEFVISPQDHPIREWIDCYNKLSVQDAIFNNLYTAITNYNTACQAAGKGPLCSPTADVKYGLQRLCNLEESNVEFRIKAIQKITQLISLEHPKVSRFHGLIENPPEISMCIDLFEEGLSSMYQMPNSPLCIKAACDISRGMQYLHSMGLLHGNLNPNSIRETVSGIVTDISELANLGNVRSSGNPMYTAPEVLNGTPPTLASDVWSFSLILYELVVGHPWYEGLPELDTQPFQELLCQGFLPPITPSIPVDIAAIISQCWARNPSERPSFSSLSQQLSEICQRYEEVGATGTIPVKDTRFESAIASVEKEKKDLLSRIASLKAQTDDMKKLCLQYNQPAYQAVSLLRVKQTQKIKMLSGIAARLQTASAHCRPTWEQEKSRTELELKQTEEEIRKTSSQFPTNVTAVEERLAEIKQLEKKLSQLETALTVLNCMKLGFDDNRATQTGIEISLTRLESLVAPEVFQELIAMSLPQQRF
ncbi:Protein tyrosine and serine/threonine kinase [Pelomyxa schiedti]|nr:Protein tyrosine and serine/threonine kinase [Pelomyxa schiedti]